MSGVRRSTASVRQTFGGSLGLGDPFGGNDNKSEGAEFFSDLRQYPWVLGCQGKGLFEVDVMQVGGRSELQVGGESERRRGVIGRVEGFVGRSVLVDVPSSFVPSGGSVIGRATTWHSGYGILYLWVQPSSEFYHYCLSVGIPSFSDQVHKFI